MTNMLHRPHWNQHRTLGIRHKTYKSFAKWLTILFATLTILAIINHFWQQEVDYHKAHKLLSPISMSAYAYDPSAGDSAKPKFPLAELPERERNIILIKNVFGRDAATAQRVFTCESGLRTHAENDHNDDGYPDIGVAQIHVTSSSMFSVDDMKNAYANLLQAKRMYDDRGWQPWLSSNNCHHAYK